jgi:putative endonuclease
MSFKQAGCRRPFPDVGSEIFRGWLLAVLRRFFTSGATTQKRIRIVDSCGDVFSDAGANPAASTIRLAALCAARSWQAASCAPASNGVLSEAPRAPSRRTTLGLVQVAHVRVEGGRVVAGPFFVYILRCADGSLYIGCTSQLSLRLQQHNDGKGGSYTSARRPLTLLYSESHGTWDGALRRERQLKLWTREKKEALIRGDLHQLKGISARRRRP